MNRTKKFTFESLAEFYAASDKYDPAAVTNPPCGSSSFLGCTAEQARARAYCYPEAVQYIAALPEMSEPCTPAAYRRVWSEDDGDEMSIDRFRDGMPFLHRRIRDKGSRRAGGAVSIFVNIGESCDVDADAMRWKAYAAARIADQIEATGARAEIFIIGYGKNAYTNGDQYEMQCRIKAAADPLNLAGIAAALMPWTLRYWMLRHIAATGRPAHGYGRPDTIKRTDPAAIYIDTGHCLSESAARRFIATAEETRKAAAASAAA
jgi:hypothetical protein